MKYLGFAVLFLLCSVAWAEDGDSQSAQDLTPLTISLSYFSTEDSSGNAIAYGVALYDKVNWYQAELICRSVGYTLLDIPDDTVQQRIQALLLASGIDLGSHSRNPLWLAGTNQGSLSEYVWHSSGARIGYNEFLINPPTNTQRCIGFNIATNYWSNHDCRDERYFICREVEAEDCP